MPAGGQESAVVVGNWDPGRPPLEMGLDSKEVDAGLPAAEKLGDLRVLPVTQPGQPPQPEAPGSAESREGQGDQLERIWDTQWQGNAVEGVGGLVPEAATVGRLRPAGQPICRGVQSLG